LQDSNKNRAGGVVQSVDPEFKPQYTHTKKKPKKLKNKFIQGDEILVS
jgi:hypothetical protein